MIRKGKLGLVVSAGFLAFAAAANGCELVADFDRTKIDGGSATPSDASTVDQSSPSIDASHDGQSPVDAADDAAETSTPEDDSGADAGPDAQPTDAGKDGDAASIDSGPDAADDAGDDSGADDAGPDA